MTEYLKLPRSALDLVADKDLWQLYGYLLSKADENGIVETSLATIQRDLKVNSKPLRTMLAKLQGANKVAKEGANKGSKITLCELGNYTTRGASKRANSGASKRANKIEDISAVTPAYTSPPFVAPEYREIWQRFTEYRREIKKPYRSESSEQTAYNKMVEMAGNNPSVAKDMVERTILGQWQGLYPKDNHGTKSITPADNAATRQASRDRMVGLASRIVSQSAERLANLYNGCGPNPYDSKD